MKVFLIGVGMGNPDTMTIGAKRAIDESDLLIGAARLLAPFKDCACEKLELISSDEISAALAKRTFNQASVLLSGDVGFYSGALALYEKLDAFDITVVPGISSLVYFCAKLRTSWQDAELVSAHGRAHDAVGAIQSHAKTFCITGGKTKVEDICRELGQRGLGSVHVCAGERLSYDDERIVCGTADELAAMQFANLSVMLVSNPSPLTFETSVPALCDSAFERGKAPMTKEEVRALVVSKMRIRPADTVWDVGAGTGSVSIAAARAANRGRVYAVEKKPEALGLIKRNCAKLGMTNVFPVAGSAPSALASLPAPNCVFIGGSSGEIDSIVEVAMRGASPVRICATAVTIETLCDITACLRNRGIDDADIVHVSVSRAEQIGSYHLMRAENPVYIVTFEAGAGDRR